LSQGADGALYGTTFWGGAFGNGVIFRYSLTGAFRVLHVFSAFTSTNRSGYGINADGADPEAALVPGDDGGFYGVAAYGGAAGCGTLFTITPDGTLTTLYSFSSKEGVNPNALIRGADGNLYGTAYQGGSQGDGAIFCLTLDGSLSLLYAFAAERTGGCNWNGCHPSGLVQAADGSLYGTAYAGGEGGAGTVFRLTSALALLSANASRDRATGNYTVAITLANTGYTTASGVTVLHAYLGAAGTVTTLPVLLGDLAPGAVTTLTLSFPASAGQEGVVVPLRLAAATAEGRIHRGVDVTLP
ncbi:MAG TPA: choice-of-anchor tandem repeat GloVer-containing protein, partial [Chthonomonadaceae bacterium]|nr:choice-of-anchor tandem repeat GloVer-containing protein [Chthonomonadaceae bacterium]